MHAYFAYTQKNIDPVLNEIRSNANDFFEGEFKKIIVGNCYITIMVYYSTFLSKISLLKQFYLVHLFISH